MNRKNGERLTTKGIREVSWSPEASTGGSPERTWSRGPWQRLGQVRVEQCIRAVEKSAASQVCTQIVHILLCCRTSVFALLVLGRRAGRPLDRAGPRDWRRLRLRAQRRLLERPRRLPGVSGLGKATMGRRKWVGYRLLAVEREAVSWIKREAPSRRHRTHPVYSWRDCHSIGRSRESPQRTHDGGIMRRVSREFGGNRGRPRRSHA